MSAVIKFTSQNSMVEIESKKISSVTSLDSDHIAPAGTAYIYFIFNDFGNLLYIGSTSNLNERLTYWQNMLSDQTFKAGNKYMQRLKTEFTEFFNPTFRFNSETLDSLRHSEQAYLTFGNMIFSIIPVPAYCRLKAEVQIINKFQPLLNIAYKNLKDAKKA